MNDLTAAKHITAAKRQCVLVLGMHRSGTSAVTRIMGLAGATMPAELLGAGEGNETGHWEPIRLIEYHDRLLAELGSRWDDWSKLSLARLDSRRRDEIKAEIRGHLNADYGQSPLFVVKEPRICRFAGLFLEALDDAGLDTSVILPVRNPIEVVSSLQRRARMWRPDQSRTYAALLWLRHVLDAEAATRGRPRSVVSYHGLLGDWRSTLERLTQNLGAAWPYGADEIAGQVETFLTPEQRHHASSLEDCVLDPVIRGWPSDTYEAMLVLERNPNSTGALQTLDRIRHELDAAEPVLTRLLDETKEWHAAAFGAVEVRVTEATQRLAEAERLREDADRRSAEAEARATEAARQLAEAERLREDADRRSAEAEARLAEVRQSATAAEARTLLAETKAAELDTNAIAEHRENERAAKAAHLEAETSRGLESKLKALSIEMAEQAAELALLKHGSRQSQGEIARLEAALAAAQSKAAAVSGSLSSSLRDSEHNLRRAREELARQTAALQAQMTDAAELSGLVERIHRSTSWRLTAPARKLKSGYLKTATLISLSRHFIQRHGGVGRGTARLAASATRSLLEGGPSRLANSARVYRDLYPAARPEHAAPAMVPASAPAPAPTPTAASVDIVICVHNALDDVRACLASVVRHKRSLDTIIIVDDGSREDTAAFLRAFTAEHGVVLSRNDTAKGYTFAANQGMRLSTADFVVLLNSDTVVTAGWLDAMTACALSDPTIGIVSPLSNCASWQSVPEIEDRGDWATNPLPPGMDADAMADLVRRTSLRAYPKVQFLNGFCYMIRRQVIEAIGHFDEATFGKGYGEENDYSLRAGAAGWALAIADDTYVLHTQSKSYSNERRKALGDAAGVALQKKHGQPVIDQGTLVCRESLMLRGIRARARQLPAIREASVRAGRWKGRRVGFVLPCGDAGGGANVVIEEARAMREMGVEASIVNLSINRPLFERSYPACPVPVAYIDGPEGLAGIAGGFDAMIATLYATMHWLAPVAAANSGLRIGYYVQDYEPYFFAAGHPEREVAIASYTLIPDARLITKTAWNRNEVLLHTGRDCTVVGPSFAAGIFGPRQHKVGAPDRIRIAGMVRFNSPRRSPELTVRTLNRISERYGEQVDIAVFGAAEDDSAWSRAPLHSGVRNLGKLSPEQIGAILAGLDIFVDYSEYQAMGLTGLEAMASGVAVILPVKGGAPELARHEHDALIIDTSREEECLEALDRLVRDDALRRALQRNAVDAAARFRPELCAARILDAVLEA